MKGENLLETAGRFWRKNDLVQQKSAQGRSCGPEENKVDCVLAHLWGRW